MTKAYIPHMDYLSTTTVSTYDYNSDKKGGNRYATVLLYMTDIPEHGGGETGKFFVRWHTVDDDDDVLLIIN